MISKYDHLAVGLMTALVVAFVGYALLLQTQDWINEAGWFDATLDFRPRSLAILAISLNLLPMNFFRARYHHKSLRGLVIGTVLLGGLWFVYYGRELLNNA